MPGYMPYNYQPYTGAYSAPTAPQYQNGISTAPTTQSGFICRPVTSGLEAEAVQVDFMGPGTIMPDLGHGLIYLKRFNPNTGTSDFLVFAEQKQPVIQYATIDDINALRSEIELIKRVGKHDADE